MNRERIDKYYRTEPDLIPLTVSIPNYKTPERNPNLHKTIRSPLSASNSICGTARRRFGLDGPRGRSYLVKGSNLTPRPASIIKNYYNLK